MRALLSKWDTTCSSRPISVFNISPKFAQTTEEAYAAIPSYSFLKTPLSQPILLVKKTQMSLFLSACFLNSLILNSQFLLSKGSNILKEC